MVHLGGGGATYLEFGVLAETLMVMAVSGLAHGHNCPVALVEAHGGRIAQSRGCRPSVAAVVQVLGYVFVLGH